jgi:hypothetical protein
MVLLNILLPEKRFGTDRYYQTKELGLFKP